MYKYVTLYDKGDFAGVIKIRDPTVLRLQYWDYPVIPIGINLIPHESLKLEEGGGRIAQDALRGNLPLLAFEMKKVGHNPNCTAKL